MTVLISIEPGAAKVPVNVDHLRRFTARLLHHCGRPQAELSIALVTDQRIAELNLSYRGRSGPTNVLAFSQTEGEGGAMAGALLGDIVISMDTAAREAKKERITLHQRLRVLLVHGLLHLLGYDHERSADEARVMFDKSETLMREMKTGRREEMIKLAINVDHVATLRQARGGVEPDPVTSAGICELAGAHGIVVHLREDRRHIQDRDVRLLRQLVKTKLNLEMGATEEIIRIALEIKPDMVTLVPEKRRELTTEGGLQVAGQKKKLSEVIGQMSAAGIPVSLFIDSDPRQVEAAKEVGATFVEIHTGRYAEARGAREQDQEFNLIAEAAELAFEAGLKVNAGHGLNYLNTPRIATLDSIEELSIGHAIMARAIFVGLDQAVREMLALMV